MTIGFAAIAAAGIGAPSGAAEISEPGEVIALPLVVTVASTAAPISLPLRVTQTAPYVRTLPLVVAVTDAATSAGLDGAGGWPAAPGGAWQAIVWLADSDISARLHGVVTVTAEADAARVAEFAFLPASSIHPLSLIGQRVRIAFAQAGGANARTLFTGVVDVPRVDLTTGLISCACHDQAQEILTNTSREWIDAAVGGRWHVAVSGEPEDNFDYLRDRIASTPASWALDELQRPRILSWLDPGASWTVRVPDYLSDSVSIDLPSREQIRTRIACTLEYRYTRLRARGARAQYMSDLFDFIPHNSGGDNRPGADFLTAQMVEAATDAVSDWEPQGPVQITHPPSGTWQIGATITSGFFSISERTAQDLAIGFNRYYVTRWPQSVTLARTVTVVWPEMEAQLGGPVAEEEGASLEAVFDSPGWGTDPSVSPQVLTTGTGDASVAWKPAGFDDASADEALRTMLDRAWTRLWTASRTGRVAFDLPLHHALQLGDGVTVEASSLRASGQIVGLAHSMDTATGQAVTSVELAVGMPGNTPAALPSWTLPDSPLDSYVPPRRSYSFRIGTYIGGQFGGPEFDPDEMIGFCTNLRGPELAGRNYYPYQLSMRSPDIADEDRDPLDLSSELTVDVAVPTDLLEIP